MSFTSILLLDSCETYAAAQRARLVEGAKVIAVTARAMAFCETHEIKYLRLDGYCDPVDLELIGRSNYTFLEEFCLKADIALQRDYSELALRKIFLASFSFYYIKISMDSLSTKLYMLLRMLEVEAPRCIIVRAGDEDLISNSLPVFTEDTNLFLALLRIIPECNSTELIQLNCKPKKSSKSAESTSASSIVRSLAGLVRAKLAALNSKIFPASTCYMLFNKGQDVSYVLPYLSKKGLVSIDPLIVRGKEAVFTKWREMVSEISLLESFSVCGHNYSLLMEFYCLDQIAKAVSSVIATFDSVVQQASSKKLLFGLAGSVNCDLIMRAAMAALQMSRIPIVTYQEGAGYGSIETPIYDYTEMRYGDLFLSYGDGNSEYYADLQWNTKPILPVGSAHQDAVIKKLNFCQNKARPFTVMYVGTSVQSNVMHCPNNGLVDTYYFNTQLNILKELSKLSDKIQIIAKLHPADIAARSFLKSKFSQKIVVEDRSFEDVLDLADLFILDFPSTTLMLACNTNAHIWLLAEQGVTGLTVKQERRLSRRTRIFKFVDDLVKSIESLSKDRAQELARGGVDIADKDYIRTYSVPYSDGNSAARAAEALIDFVSVGMSKSVCAAK